MSDFGLKFARPETNIQLQCVAIKIMSTEKRVQINFVYNFNLRKRSRLRQMRAYAFRGVNS